jgi:hypothetical protein
MNLFPKIVTFAMLLTCAARAVTPSRTEVAVTVKDARGHSVNDLKQGDFEVYIDGRPVDISWWMSARDFRHHTVYTIRFEPGNPQHEGKHTIVIHVKRDGARPEYPSTLSY